MLARLVWASPASPHATHDLTAARAHNIITALTDAEFLTLAGQGYAGPVRRSGCRSTTRTCRSGCASATAHSTAPADTASALNATLKT
jgi:hypothetical protein